MPSKIQVRRGYLSSSDLEAFLAASRDDRELLWWLLMCDAGMRVGEVRSLLWSQVGRSHIQITGKGSKTRRVPVTSRLWEAYIDARPPGAGGCAEKLCPIGTRSVEMRFGRAARRAGLAGKPICVHSLRHTFASRALLAGIDIYRVGVLLGHSSIHTTLGYLHTSEEDLAEAAQLLDKLRPQGGLSGDRFGIRIGGGKVLGTDPK